LALGYWPLASASSVPLCFKGFGFQFWQSFQIRLIRVDPR
jgi:hypothetical protein